MGKGTGAWQLNLAYSSSLPVAVYLTAQLVTPCCAWPLHRANDTWPQDEDEWVYACRACGHRYPALSGISRELQLRFTPEGGGSDVGSDVIESWLEACEVTDPLSSVIVAHELVGEFRRVALGLEGKFDEDDDPYLEGLVPLESRAPLPEFTSPA